jgi:uncharacterized membrane-anchored protein/uncharacterized membrane protein
MNLRLVKAGYFMGIGLVMASVIYFFAANWQGFDRLEKIVVSIGVMCLLYGISILLAYVMNRHDFLSQWLFVAGAIGFGVSVALIGQIYNSHADSFWLFFIWFIPSAVFALITRYEPFRVLSAVLLQLTFWFYYFPSSYQTERDQWVSFLFLLVFAAVNGAVFFLHRSSFVSYLLYVAMQGWLFLIVGSGLTEGSFTWWPYVYSLLLLVFLYYFFAIVKHRSYVLITSLFAGGFLIVQYFRFVARHFQEGVLLAGLLLAAGIVYGSLFLLKRLRNWAMEENAGTTFLAVFQAIVTAVASIIAISSIMGLFSLWTHHFSSNLLFALSVGAFVLPGMLMQSWNDVVRCTLLAIGYGVGVIASMDISIWIVTTYFLVLLVGYFKSEKTGIKLLTHVALSAFGMLIVEEWSDKLRLALLFVVLLNAFLYMASHQRKHTQRLSLFIGMGSLLLLTSMDFFALDLWVVLANLLLIFITAGWIAFQSKQQEPIGLGIAWFYLWLFLVLKYYEFAWSLLDKAISLLIFGILVLAGTIFLEKKKHLLPNEQVSWVRSKWIPLLMIIALQIVFIGYTVFDKERLLRNGEVVKLELMPMDPRSLLQGDYVRLRYEISQIQGMSGNGKVQLILQKDEAGVYRFARVYVMNGKKDLSYIRKKSEVIINGKWQGDTILYGIESFFVPEKTGIELQQRARYAYVRVSQTGDALLESVSDR